MGRNTISFSGFEPVESPNVVRISLLRINSTSKETHDAFCEELTRVGLQGFGNHGRYDLVDENEADFAPESKLFNSEGYITCIDDCSYVSNIKEVALRFGYDVVLNQTELLENTMIDIEDHVEWYRKLTGKDDLELATIIVANSIIEQLKSLGDVDIQHSGLGSGLGTVDIVIDNYRP